MAIIDIPAGILAKAGVKKPKVAIYGTIAVIGGIVILTIVLRRIKRARDNAAARMTNALLKSNQEDQLSSINTSGASISKGDAIIISQNLLNAMGANAWSWMGTDEQQIFDNFDRLKNKADLELVIQTFGVQPYAWTGLATSWLQRQVAIMKNLNGWLRTELSGRALEKIQAIYYKFGVPF